MVVELVTAAALVYFSKDSGFFIFNLLAVVLLWLCTFFLSVPLHTALEKASDQQVLQQLIEQLVNTNWPRTLLWSFRSIALLTYFSVNVKVLNVDF